LARVLSLSRDARVSALLASAAIALVGTVAGSVRLLPWLLDPAVPWGVALPFARGLVAVALEAAVLVGWPVGWALASCRFVERGEGRVLLALGERPIRTVGRLAPQGAALALLLSAVALVYAGDARAPGRVATELVAQARAACVRAATPTTYSIPFTDMTWLCAPGRPPRLVSRGPGAMRGALFTASDARIAGDFRAVELDDARVQLGTTPAVTVHVHALSMRGMAPWARASILPAYARAILLSLTAWAAASLAVLAVLCQAVRARAGAIVIGAIGPVAALGILRVLERASAPSAAFVLLPLAACAACAACAGLAMALPRLRHRMHTAMASRRV
jgi:hypothetical protein